MLKAESGSRSTYSDCVGPMRGADDATKVPRPTVAASNPSWVASWYARDTVPGVTPTAQAKSRTVGSCAPSARDLRANSLNVRDLERNVSLLEKICLSEGSIHAQSSDYFKKLLLNNNIVPYTGILLSFQDLLLPMMSSLKKLSFMPNKPIFLLIDDADNLNLTQTKVLNTWVSYRSTETLSLKISTQTILILF